MQQFARILLGCVASLAAGCVTQTVSSSVEASSDHPFYTLAQHCKTFDRAFFWTPAGRHNYLVYLDGRGRVTAERVSGWGKRYHWDGTTAYYDDHNLDAPEARPEWGHRIADVWSECRSGFAQTTVTEESPLEYGGDFGGSPLQRWARLQLPFEWADGLLVFVTDNNQGLPDDLVIGVRGALVRYPFVQFRWTATFPDDKLTPHASETSVGMPPDPHPDGLWYPG